MNTVARLLGLAIISLAATVSMNAQSKSDGWKPTLSTLQAGSQLNGFRVTSVYANDAGDPIGGRFAHISSGFTLDLIEMQSVPQSFLWVNSFPTSDMGEPHTQEHLLLGKGNVGRYVANLEDMALATSSAFTQQLRTCYHFNTGAGPEAFYTLFSEQLNALLYPDYTDEEIRREVRNFGVTENPADGSLRLEEKGTVYNEMVSAFERPWTRLGRELGLALYGSAHPAAYVSGGAPEAIRRMQPEHIRTFHAANYHTGNMGMIASLPKEMELRSVLARMDGILGPIAKRSKRREGSSLENLPAPKMAPAGTIRVVDYPQSNAAQPGPVVLTWAPTLHLSARDYLTLEMFLDNIGGDPSTNLYKLFIDTKTRSVDVGASSVFAWVDTDPGHPISIGLGDVPPANMTEEKMKMIRDRVTAELARIAALPDGSADLVEFNARINSRVIERRRANDKFVNSPPGFGFRGASSAWMNHLDRLAESPEFRKILTMKSDLDWIERIASDRTNRWRELLASWKLTTTTPYVFAARPSPELVQREAREREERNMAELARLKTLYATSDDQAALRRYQKEYDSVSAALDLVAAQAKSPKFIDSPPMTLDDQLDYQVTKLRGGVPMVASYFDNMNSATVGIALGLRGLPKEDMVYVSALPTLLTGVGVIEKGITVSYETMSERQRREILGLSAYFSTNNATGRAELVVRGAGNDAAETERAIEWMQLVLQSPDWRSENLPRIRDLVDQQLTSLRNTMQGREEAWVNNPSSAYYRQDDPVLLAANSFLTRTHNFHRLRWLLKDAGSAEDAAAIGSFLEKLTGASSFGPAKVQMLLAAMKGDSVATGRMHQALSSIYEAFNALPAGAKPLALDAIRDLDQTLNDIPGESFAADWSYLCRQIRNDLLVSPASTLDRLNEIRRSLLGAPSARMFMIGSHATEGRLSTKIDQFLAGLATTAAPRVELRGDRLVSRRIRERTGATVDPVYVGLVNPNTGSGVFLHSAPLTSYDDLDKESLLRYLASKLYGGGGAHGVFMRTWGAGLAYSNGLGSSPASGRLNYYAERCPELPQTLRFVIDDLKNAKPDSTLVEYAIAQAFSEIRAGSSYESRGESMAADIADSILPSVVKEFRTRLLKLRSTPNLTAALFERMHAVYGQILPGYNVKGKDVKEGVFMTIGPERQLAIYEEYLKSVEGPETRLFRLYPRDFWQIAPVSGPEALK